MRSLPVGSQCETIPLWDGLEWKFLESPKSGIKIKLELYLVNAYFLLPKVTCISKALQGVRAYGNTLQWSALPYKNTEEAAPEVASKAGDLSLRLSRRPLWWMVAIPHATLVFSKNYKAFSALNLWPKNPKKTSTWSKRFKKRSQDFSLKPPLNYLKFPLTYSPPKKKTGRFRDTRPGHPRSDIQKAGSAPPAATQWDLNPPRLGNIHRKKLYKYPPVN